MKELGAEVGGGLIIHHGLIIRTLRYIGFFHTLFLPAKQCLQMALTALAVMFIHFSATHSPRQAPSLKLRPLRPASTEI